MGSRALRVVLLVSLVGVLAWRVRSCQTQVEEKRRIARRQNARFEQQTADAPSPLPLDPYARRAAIADSMRLQPDRRFVAAVAQIEELTGGRPETASVRFDGGRWKLATQAEALGEWPESPDFPELMAPLVGFAGRRLKERPLAGADPKAGPALQWEPEARAALPALLARWSAGEKSPAVLHGAARAAAALVFYSSDPMEAADAFGARAVALAALDKAAGLATGGDEALLASALGYSRAARDGASRMQGEDSLRYFLSGDDAHLREAALLREAGPVDRYLRLRRAIERQDERDANEFLDSYHGTERLDLAVLMVLLRQGEMANFAPVAFALPVFLLAAAEGVAVQAPVRDKQADTIREAVQRTIEALRADPQAISQRLEQALQKRDPDVAGYLRTAWISALRRQGEFFSDYQADRASTARFRDALAKDPQPAPQLVHRWFAARALAADGKVVPALDAAEKLTGMGGGAVAAVAKEIASHAEFSDPRPLRGVRALLPRLDSRPSHRRALAGLAWEPLQDLRASERLYRSALEVDPETNGALREWFARLSGDDAALVRIGSDKFELRRTRGTAWSDLWQLGPGFAAQAEKGLRAMLDEEPNDDRTALALAKRLRLSGRLEEARAVLLAWLRPNDVPGLKMASIRSNLSRYSYLAGRFAEGLEVVGPALPVGNQDSMAYAALNLAGLGRAVEARQMTDQLLQRYRNAFSVAAAAEVEWRLGDPDGAARRIAGSGIRLTLTAYQEEIAEAFASIFGEKPDQAAAAAQALVQAKVDYGSLSALAAGVEGKGHPEAAFRVLELTHEQGDREDVIRMTALRALRKARGAASVPGYVEKSFPGMRDDRGAHLALLAFREGIPEMVWDVVRAPQGNDAFAETIWMMRAAQVALAGPSASEARRQLLHEHYAAAGQPTRHTQIGRYLIGELPEAEAARLVTNLPASCEVPYYLGVRAQGEKRFGDAADWYRTAIECGQHHEAEYVLARNALHLFKSEANPLGRLR